MSKSRKTYRVVGKELVGMLPLREKCSIQEFLEQFTRRELKALKVRIQNELLASE